MTDLPTTALQQALDLVMTVHDEGPPEVQAAIQRITDVPAVLVTLAALVPANQTVQQLLAWNDDKYQTCTHPHSSQAAYDWHRQRGERPCRDCRLGEELRQQARRRVLEGAA